MTFDPKTNRVPLDVLSSDERKALENCGGPYERWSYGFRQWLPENSPTFSAFWAPEAIIRQASPYTGIWMSRQLLDMLDPKWQWFARNASGLVHCFSERPGRGHTIWVGGGNYKFLSEVYRPHHLDPGTCYWKDSLVSRDELESRAGDRR